MSVGYFRTMVKGTTRFVGFHHWPDAPEGRAYLRDLHRHIFHVSLSVFVKGSNREIEFHDLQCWLIGAVLIEMPPMNREDKSTWSCEQIAERIVDLAVAAGYRPAECEVSEDGENGAVVRWWGE